MKHKWLGWILSAVSCTFMCSPTAVAQTKTFAVADVLLNVEIISAQTHLKSPSESTLAPISLGVKPHARLLWLPSEYGILPQERALAKQLSAFGIESWFVDVYDGLFLAPTATAVDEVPTEWISQLIDFAANVDSNTESDTESRLDSKNHFKNQQASFKNAGDHLQTSRVPLWIIAPNKAAQLAVRGLVDFQQTSRNQIGLILLNPNLYLNTPKPGEEAQYWSQVSALNLPVSILQAEQSPWRWRVMSLAEALQSSGSDVFVQLQKQARDRFYFRADALPEEREITADLADTIRSMMRMQLPYLTQSRQAGLLTLAKPNQVESTRSAELQVFNGEQGRLLQLENLQGDKVALSDYNGQVVLLNFWASWCPPCVHEMPSMARLKTQLKDQPFEILAVNLAEPKSAIQAFTKAHPVNFPILLDPAGSAVKSWQVFAYPSTYLIDKQGQIRYALFGGTEWDAVHHVDKVNALLAE